jgi:RNA-splicing ligase RtcB
MSANISAECGAIELARAWPKTLKHPESRLFSLSVAANPQLVSSYLQAEATAANYGFINRLLLAELLRWRWRQVFGDVETPFVYDLPHNITLAEGAGWVTRKGACPAHSGQPVIRVRWARRLICWLVRGTIDFCDRLLTVQFGGDRAAI